jgi:hypothetical protein
MKKNPQKRQEGQSNAADTLRTHRRDGAKPAGLVATVPVVIDVIGSQP